MARLLLAVYLLTGLFGRGGIVLCEESDSSLSLESWLQRCCAEEEQGHESLPHDEEAADSLCPAECGCVDWAADLLLTHRADVKRVQIAAPASEPSALPPDVAGAYAHAPRVTDASPPWPACRPERSSAGAAPRVLRT